MAMTSPVVLSVLLLASLTALLVLAPRLSPPAAVASAGDEAPPRPGARVGEGVGATSKGPGVGEEADDLRLFRRVALEAAAATGPPKVAFLFLTNSDLTFAPLWERFFAGNAARFTVYVHADPAAALRLAPTPSFRGRFIAAKPTRHADASLIAASRRLLAAALLDDPANAYFALLSQHCVPLHSFDRLYAALFPPPPPPPHAAAARHRRLPSYIEVLTGEPQMPSRYAARGGESAMLPEVPYERFRIGSQFFTLARRHAVLVVRERRLWRKFRAPCLPEAARDECYPEEHYLPTLLDMADPAGVARYTLTRVNWTGSVAGHPYRYAAARRRAPRLQPHPPTHVRAQVRARLPRPAPRHRRHRHLQGLTDAVALLPPACSARPRDQSRARRQGKLWSFLFALRLHLQSCFKTWSHPQLLLRKKEKKKEKKKKKKSVGFLSPSSPVLVI